QDVDRPALRMNCAQHRVRHRVIAADGDRTMTGTQRRQNRALDDVVVAIRLAQRRIAAVVDDQIATELMPVLGGDRGAIARERGTNERGPLGGPAQVGRMAIGWQTDQGECRLHLRIMPEAGYGSLSTADLV